ncbi:hypothetical protein [Zoogloea sp. 1C4]|uniref:hypothetical protein n=1 Tax=Zoogloea sp. 1C4 TaxID=2570190 RepID=UPI001292ADD8|nr:hypothetical protein [Zoogloea sp. 1C4]
MNPAATPHPAITAAWKMLELARAGFALPVIDVETAAWVLGLHGEVTPPLPEPAHTHARLAAALAADDAAKATALLHDRLPRPGMERLLIHACHLGGHRHADALLDVALAHPAAWFNGAMLAGTSRPAELLARLDVSRGQPLSMPDIVTIAELVLRGLDAGQPCPAAEALWQPLADAPDALARHPQFRTAHLRFLARRDPASARTQLLRYAETYPRSDLYVGAVAVLARLLATDPAAAVALVAASDEEADVSVWLPALCWRFELPAAAHPLVTRLLDSTDPETGLDLVTALARTPNVAWLQRAWKNTEGLADRDERIVRAIAPALMQLHAAGLTAQADTLTSLADEWLGDARVIDGQLPATGLLRVLGAPGLPPLVPWGKGFALP